MAAVIGCASHTGNTSADAYSSQDPKNLPYVIGPSDVVRVTVWKDPSLSTETTVRPDGRITVPLLGEIDAAGHTAAQVKADIESRLTAYVKDAIVTVAVVEVNSYRFTVAGNVERPGMFTPRYYTTVAEAIALAGGPNRFASVGQVVLIRPRPGQQPARIVIDYEKILSGEKPGQNIVLRAGDTLLVP